MTQPMNKDFQGVAVVGMACQYPDARSSEELFSNALTQRRAFRKMPSNRLNEDYFSDTDGDKIYTRTAAVIEGYQFDRSRYKISGKSFRGADLVHWLALDVATHALEDAGLLESEFMPKRKTGVFLGNTLTGEFSRANVMRLRWPFIEKLVKEELQGIAASEEDVSTLLGKLENNYKAHFPQLFEDSLAGGLSNTIAGRICNYYDFNGGGYSVDGACSSSLLAIIDACRHIESGENTVCLAGGVDLSLDPFELVGFSRTGALAKKEMLVYDAESNGFWPGEGCGFIVLADLAFAERYNLNIQAVIKGYGISTDGQGGLTRPSVNGQRIAYQRAYDKANYSVGQVDYFEGHGTGTEVGDKVELSTVVSALADDALADQKKHYIGSIKANIGHTKAAAGVAGFIKAVKVLQHRTIPAMSGCKQPNAALDDTLLTIPKKSVKYEGKEPMRASVSAMGFGGINSHITIEEKPLIKGRNGQELQNHIHQDSEVYLFSSTDKHQLTEQVRQVSQYAAQISLAEMVDLSQTLYAGVHFDDPFRLAVVANSPADLFNKLNRAATKLESGAAEIHHKGIHFCYGVKQPRIGYLFAGQGSKVYDPENHIISQFPGLPIPEHYPKCGKKDELGVVQPSIVGTAIVANELLNQFGVSGRLGLGHSLGEISALYWSGALTGDEAIDLAEKRGRIMECTPGLEGKMLIIGLPGDRVAELIGNQEIYMAAKNSIKQTVVSGAAETIKQFQNELKEKKIFTVLLPVSHAFHSPALQAIEQPFAEAVRAVGIKPPSRTFISSYSGNQASDAFDIQDYLVRQLSTPVNFLDAVTHAEDDVDVWVELSGDQTLFNIVKNISDKPIASLALDGSSMTGLFDALALVWASSHDVRWSYLFDHKMAKEFDLAFKPSFFTNPCESGQTQEHLDAKETEDVQTLDSQEGVAGAFIHLIAENLELPIAEVKPELRLLDDLHMNSLEVGHLIAEFATKHDIVLKGVPTEYANASIQEIINVLEIDKASGKAKNDLAPLAPWVHYFQNSLTLSPLNLSKRLKELEVRPGHWTLFEGPVLYGKEQLQELPGTGLICRLEPTSTPELIDKLERLLQWLQGQELPGKLVLLNGSNPISGFFKSIFLEQQALEVLIINTDQYLDFELLKQEVVQQRGFVEVDYIGAERFEKRFSPVFQRASKGSLQLGEGDVVLVTGGGKGITAECALALGRRYPLTLVLLGRSNPDDNSNLANNLERFRQAEVRFEYIPVDITDEAAFAEVINKVKSAYGKISGVIHGAGINHPVSWKELDASNIRRTCQAKVEGLKTVLNHVSADQMKFLISFGSIIGESGMTGNADYALANELLREEVDRYEALNSNCRCFNAAWSVWSGAGMGEDLGVLESLMASGIQPIGLEKGIQLFMSWMDDFPAETNLVIAGRYGKNNTLNELSSSVPFLRFVDKILMHYPAIELISEFELSYENDLYLKDHAINDRLVFPAVMGLEAITQNLRVLYADEGELIFEEVKFAHPIAISKGQSEKVRVYVCRVADDHFRVALRCGSTDFCVEHFQASVIVGVSSTSTKSLMPFESEQPLAVEVKRDIYDSLLFHTGIFRVIETYTDLDAYACRAIIDAQNSADYFSAFLSDEILTLAPTARDGALQCVQGCVPDYTLLPIEVKSIQSFTSSKNVTDRLVVEAREMAKDDKVYAYDIVIKNQEEDVLEVWEQVKFKVLKAKERLELPMDLAKNIAQRRMDELSGKRGAFQFAIGQDQTLDLLTRYDRKPFMTNGFISKSHLDNLSVSLMGTSEVGIDLERVEKKDLKQWENLLGQERYQLAAFLSKRYQEDIYMSCTRVWGVMEALKKSGMDLLESIRLNMETKDHVLIFKCGGASVHSLCFHASELEAPVVLTFLHAEAMSLVPNE